MTDNFQFCNEVFLPLFNSRPGHFYNQFGNEKFTKEVLDSMGKHPGCKIEFRYHDAKRIRATFVTFEDAKRELDVACICVLFHGDRLQHHCYFYEVYENGSIGCIETTNQNRIVRELNVGTDIDSYFERLCASFGESKYDTVTMLFYRESDECFRVLDIELPDLACRSRILLGAPAVRTRETHQGVDFLIYQAQDGGSYIAARTADGENPTDALLCDMDILKLR